MTRGWGRGASLEKKERRGVRKKRKKTQRRERKGRKIAQGRGEEKREAQIPRRRRGAQLLWLLGVHVEGSLSSVKLR